jgi:hypothetical protein
MIFLSGVYCNKPRSMIAQLDAISTWMQCMAFDHGRTGGVEANDIDIDASFAELEDCFVEGGD